MSWILDMYGDSPSISEVDAELNNPSAFNVLNHSIEGLEQSITYLGYLDEPGRNIIDPTPTTLDTVLETAKNPYVLGAAATTAVAGGLYFGYKQRQKEEATKTEEQKRRLAPEEQIRKDVGRKRWF